jgi:Uma2 family endonuclease
MSTVARIVTADELLRLPRGKVRYELVRGELLTMSPAGSERGAVIGALFLLVAEHVKRHRLGMVFGAETGFLIEQDPDTVRAPDIAYVRRERIPAGGPPVGYWPGSPDLAVEVVSPSDIIREIDAKVADWLSAGCQAVWVVYPRSKTVTVYIAGGEIRMLAAEQILDGGSVLPGFTCPVSEIFAIGP